MCHAPGHCQASMHTGVVRPRGVNPGNRRPIEAEMEGCQVRYWIGWRKRYVIFTNVVYDMLIKV